MSSAGAGEGALLRRPAPGLSLAAACAVCVVLRLPAFRYDVISDDEAIYDAMARTLAAGGVMYRDAVDHKPPGLAYTYAFLHRLAGGDGALAMTLVHLLGVLAAVGTCLALYAIAKRVLRPSLWALPPLLYAVVSVCKQPPDGLAVNGELLMNLPIAFCVVCALAATVPQSRARALALDALAGALGAVATLYKYQAAVVLLALPALWIGDPRFAVLLRRALATALGVLLPIAAVAWYFGAHGALSEAYLWGVAFNRSYIGGGPGFSWGAQRFLLQLLGVIVPALLLYAAGLAALVRLARRRPQDDVIAARAFLVFWTALSLLAVAVGSRYFGHYFLQPEVPLSLLAAGGVERFLAARPRLAVASLAAPALLFFAAASAKEITQPLFSDRDPDYRGIGNAIAARTGKGDTIWVWGNVPQLYYSSSRTPGVRFSFCNYLTGLSPGTPSEYDDQVDPGAQSLRWAWALVLRDLRVNKPALVLDTAAAGLKSYGKFPIRKFPQLADYLAAHYRREGDLSGVVVYRRID
jgi:hypothetical protein